MERLNTEFIFTVTATLIVERSSIVVLPDRSESVENCDKVVLPAVRPVLLQWSGQWCMSIRKPWKHRTFPSKMNLDTSP